MFLQFRTTLGVSEVSDTFLYSSLLILSQKNTKKGLKFGWAPSRGANQIHLVKRPERSDSGVRAQRGLSFIQKYLSYSY